MARTCPIALSIESSAGPSGGRGEGATVVSNPTTSSAAVAAHTTVRCSAMDRPLLTPPDYHSVRIPARALAPHFVQVVEANLDLLHRIGRFVFDDVPLGAPDGLVGLQQRLPVDLAF